MTYQIIAKWSEKTGKHYLRIEPNSYWCDVMNEEEIWEKTETLKEAEKKLKEYQR